MNDYGFIHKYPYTNFHELNLDYLLELYNQFYGDIDSFKQRLDDLDLKVDDIYALYNEIISGEFPEEVKNAFYEWMSENAFDLVGSMVKMVFFGITTDGYFVAYIPDSWKDIQFGTTGYDDFPSGVEYGHLTLSY